MYDPKAQTLIEEGETVVATFQADRPTYLKSHAILAVVAGLGATLALGLIGNPYPWVGIVAGVLGIGVRGAFLMSEELAATWTLTEAAIYGPGGRRLLLENLAKVRKIGNAVQLVTPSGDKHLIKFVGEPDAVVNRIEAAKRGNG
ncbi:hypothetical protein RGUI_2079 [Rhodovulum sp. P5]|uniref:hypothetical protein n=1 Tax=Rhodovulum sp. P5 TaxID=1564506 RepID=UPI0009C2B646|nr:hypothetical protein [Rhodovulum sp. P5]ARE40220.1 hypothetical protein RGUI_2079 [Rhodovulum sp. P5]